MTSNSLNAVLIAVDWGTTNLRAFALDKDGNIVSERGNEFGIQNVKNNGFRNILNNLIDDWRDEAANPVPVLMSGMIGSRQGWLEAPYAPCPVNAKELAGGLAGVPGEKNTWIVPGICLPPDTDQPDVARGEEVQVFGALDYLKRSEALFCLPGTHSKWVKAEKGAITEFSTAITGEIFKAVSEHTIIGALLSEDTSYHHKAFEQGLEHSGQPGGLLNHLFSVRTKGLFNSLPADSLSSYLSGILIGHEIRELSVVSHKSTGEVVLLGSSTVSKRYSKAFDYMGLPHILVDNNIATTRGLLNIARHAELIN